MANGPLKGFKVLDLSRLLPGPYASLVLSDLGADVVKVEDPAPGDYMRDLVPGIFAAVNRGKRSIVLDLKSSEGTRQLERLAQTADVLIESFRPGVLERLLPPPWPEKLIVCRISGFGQDGPWRERAGHDIGYLAISGAIARNGNKVPAMQLADLFGGAQNAVIGILAALLEKRGRVIDISMAHGATGLLLPAMGDLDTPNILDGSRPCYRVYACSTGAYALGALEPKFWQSFCKAVGRPEWMTRQFDHALTPEADALFATRTRDQWDALLRPFDCCGEPVLEPDELRDHPLFAETLFAGELPRTFPALAGEVPRSPAPRLGEHTAAVLAEWGAIQRP